MNKRFNQQKYEDIFMNTKKEETPITDFLTDFKINVGSTERVASAVGAGALITLGLRQGGILGGLLAAVGGSLAVRAVSGHCHLYSALGVDTSEDSPNPKSPYHVGFLDQKIHVTKSVTVNKSPAEVYSFWRQLNNLPQFMSHLESVTLIDNKRSRWVAKAPFGTTVEWDAEITSDIENERIGWKSVEDSEIVNSGVVIFQPTQDRGTQVKVFLTYEPPAGKLGSLVAKLFGEEPDQQVANDLRRFKSLMETGTVMTVEGQPSGREPESRKATA
jgi:uncharacterized membrane protein